MDANDVTLKAPDEIDPSTADDFAATLAQVPAGATVQVDCAAVEFIDSSGLRVLIEARQRYQEGGGQLQVVNPSPTVLRLLELTGLSDLLLNPADNP